MSLQCRGCHMHGCCVNSLCMHAAGRRLRSPHGGRRRSPSGGLVDDAGNVLCLRLLVMFVMVLFIAQW